MQQRDFTLIANLVSDKIGIRMVPQPFGWAANLKKGIIYYPQYLNYQEADLGFLLHEGAHLRFSDISHTLDKDLKKWVATTGKRAEQVWALVNALEDCRIEYLMKKTYAGAEYYLERAYSETIDEVLSGSRMMKFRDYKAYKERQKKHWLHYGMYWVIKYAIGRKYAKDYFKAWNVSNKVLDAVAKTEKDVEGIFACKSTGELMDLMEKKLLPIYLPLCEDDLKPEEKEKMKEEFEKAMKELVKQLKEKIEEAKKKLDEEKKQEKKREEEKKEEKKKQSSGGGKPEEASGQEEGDNEGKGGKGKDKDGKNGDGGEKEKDRDGNEKGEDNKGRSEQESPQSEENKKPKKDKSGENPSKQEGEEEKQEEDKGSGNGGSGGQEQNSETDPDAESLEREGFGLATGDETETLQAGQFDENDNWTPADPKGSSELNPVEELFGLFTPPPASSLDLSDLDEAVKLHLAKVRKAVSILKDISTERYEGSYESGKLEARRLYKVLLNKTRVFTRKIADTQSDKDMVIMVLVDESGSMRGYGDRGGGRIKCEEACISATLLARVLELSNKPFAVYGFNAYDFIHKDFHERLKLKKMLEIIKNAEGHGAHSNNDGWAIHNATQALLKQPQKNKILIVLSDGEPAPTSDKYQYELKQEAKKAEKFVKVYSIGINSEAVKEYYKRAVVVNDVASLGSEMMKIFKENVGKRAR